MVTAALLGLLTRVYLFARSFYLALGFMSRLSRTCVQCIRSQLTYIVLDLLVSRAWCMAVLDIGYR